MRDPDQFDQFYKDVRTRLLLLTYCLTGDLSSSRAAVRDAFVVTWHHWRKVSRIDDPEAWTRAHASGRAQRRHTAKLWHREKGLDPEVHATLAALAKLSVTQRKVLLLTELTTVSLDDMAREVGLPRHEAEQALQTATSQFAVHRGVATTSVRAMFEPVRKHVEDVRWPRATIIRRAGSTRRRTHTLVGVAATVAALVVTGTLVSDSAGLRPTLSAQRIEAAVAGSDEAAPAAEPSAPPVELPEDALLTADQVGKLRAGSWRVGETTDNAEGDGRMMPCQESRYADAGLATALVRTFETGPAKAPAAATTVQVTEASMSPRAAARGYRAAVSWFAGCDDDRAQLLSTHAVDGVGDEATLLALRTWQEPTSTIVAGVARTGQFTTVTFSRTPDTGSPDLTGSARLLASAVSGLCDLPDAGACAGRPKLEELAPIPVGSAPGMLAEVDLPPVSGVEHPWVGTEPRQARDNAAATRCDQADFSGEDVTNGITRTFLVPGADVPVEFGLTETVGSLPEPKAAAFVADVRDRLAGCADKQMGTDVVQVRHVDEKHRDLSVWHVTTEISDDESVTYLMGIVRDGTTVAQVGFVPAQDRTMAPGAFLGVVDRALDRLPALPKPKKN